MSKVVCIGECLVDMMPSKSGYVPNAGGAPCNVCACVASLGGDGAYLGKLGGDAYSDFLFEKIKSAGIDIRYIVFDKSLKTALAFVNIDENGDRKFRFERENTADLNLSAADVKDDCLQNGDVLHFCSLGLAGKSKSAHEKAIKLAIEKGATISFDVNVRENLWNNIQECVIAIKEFLPFADIVRSQAKNSICCRKAKPMTKKQKTCYLLHRIAKFSSSRKERTERLHTTENCAKFHNEHTRRKSSTRQAQETVLSVRFCIFCRKALSHSI